MMFKKMSSFTLPFFCPAQSLSPCAQVNSVVAKEQLNQCVSELRGVLAERQGALAMLMEGARAQRAGALNAQLSEKQSLLENAGLLTYTQELLKEPDQPCFVQAARVTHNRLDCV